MDRQKEKDFPGLPTCSSNSSSCWGWVGLKLRLELGWAEIGSLGLHLDFLGGWQELHCLSHHALSLSVH